MSRETGNPWHIEDADFPKEEVRSAQLEFLVRYAVLAPSTHNSQPWLFRVRGDALEILADRTRRLPVADPDDRELIISCGAALQFARLAARNIGYEGAIEILPDPADQTLLGRLRLGAFSSPTQSERRRFAAIPDRHTARTPLGADPQIEQHLAVLENLAAHYGVIFRTFRDDASRNEIAELVREADIQQMHSAAFRRELASWVRSTRSRRRDGMSVSSFGMRDRLSGGFAAALSLFDFGRGTANRHRDLALEAPAVALLATIDDDPKCWMRTGMAVADILLEMTACGLAGSFLNQAIEVPEFRHRIEARFCVELFPQMLLRIGSGVAPSVAVRRPAEAVTEKA